MSIDTAQIAPLARMREVTKSYPGVVALQDVSIDFAAHEVHALVGENGAGKSTLMKVLAGAVRPDAGTVEICQIPVHHGDPRASAAAGLAMIYQELSLVPDLSAVRNVFLADPPRRWGWLREREMRRAFRDLNSRIGAELSPSTPARQLPLAKQQLVEIMRALATDSQVVVFDEPTASLGPGDREHLHAVVRRLREQGRSIVYITHDLDEVLTLSDRVTVMREGRIVASAPTEEWTKRTLVNSMLGHALAAPQPRVRAAAGSAKPALRVRSLTAASGTVRVEGIHVDAGEIVGIGGLLGSGRSEFLLALAGADPTASGTVSVAGGADRGLPRTVGRALARGIALLPEDRKGQGLVLGQSASFNITLPNLAGASTKGWISPSSADRAALPYTASVGFDPSRLGVPAGNFSGGNQQKLLLARWLYRRPRLLMLDEPTRGIDIGAKEAVFSAVRQLAEEGMAIILVSSDLEEVVAHSDRVLVMTRGRITGEIPSPRSVGQILDLAFAVDGIQQPSTLSTTKDVT